MRRKDDQELGTEENLEGRANTVCSG